METNLSIVSNSYTEYAKSCIEGFVKANGRLPQKKEIQTEVSVDYLVSTYGSWNNALVQLGIKDKAIKVEETLELLKELRDSLGVIPSIKNVKDANIDVKNIIAEYGSWNIVKTLLKEDFVTAKPKRTLKRNITAEEKENLKIELGNSIIELTKTLMKVPTIVQLKEEKISISKVMRYFGSWNKAKEELKLNEIEKDVIINELTETQKMTTERISVKDLNDADINVGRVKKLFGSWKKAYNEIGLEKARKECVKERVIDLTNKLQRTPSCKEIKQEGIPLLFITRETPWREVKSEWELDKISNSYTINEIIQLSKNIDYTPTIQEIRENNIKPHRLFKLHGGWNKVREMIGLPKHSIYSNTYINEMESKLLDLAEENGKTPTYSLAKASEINVSALKSRHSSWNNVLFNLGLKLNSKYTDEAIVSLTKNVKDLAEMIGKTPTIKDLKEYGIAINPLRRKYGSLEECFDSIGLIPNTQTDKTYTKEKVLNSIKNLADKMGKIPSAKKTKEEGIKITRLIKELGSWKNVKESVKSISLNGDSLELQPAI